MKHIDVVLMAGGFGKRLQPLTNICPKPLLKIGGKPILELIIENFVKQKFYFFYISLHYKPEMIQDYFQDGSKWGCKIEYILEKEPLGTAGVLSLLPPTLSDNFIVMNSDVLAEINFEHLCDYHFDRESMATMCVREHSHTIPYGVVEMNHHKIRAIREKPSYKYYVNAGIYMFNKQVIKNVPKNTHYDMPVLFQSLVDKELAAITFPLNESWQDIGHIEDYNKILSQVT